MLHKLEGFEFWTNDLKSAKFVLAPMVDQSDLAWRMLSRRYGADLCFTQMLHASVFVRDANYRKKSFVTCDGDRPLIVQFSANDPDTLLKAARLAENYCDAIDLNIGCPQSIARRGHYGAFLQDEWDLLSKMVNMCHENLSVPITCKIRVFSLVEKTVQYAKMLESAGCQLLTVHGRTIDQKGIHTGLACWDIIKAVREAVKIPVIANGNIRYLHDVERCLEETGVQGIMSAEGNLHNPALFQGLSPPVWKMAKEYLELVEKYPSPMSCVRGHLVKLFYHALQIHRDIFDAVVSSKCIGEFKEATERLKKACQMKMDLHADCFLRRYQSNLPLPYWICQPYVRPGPNVDSDPEKQALRQRLNQLKEEQMKSVEEFGLSKIQMKKRLKYPLKNFDPSKKIKFQPCSMCPNLRGSKCKYDLCRNCCRLKMSPETLDCEDTAEMTKEVNDMIGCFRRK